jgi:hypothetical protein
MEPVTVNFAMTREDFVNGAAARLRMQTDGTYGVTVRLTGACMVALGCVLFAVHLAANRPVQWLGAVCVLFGAFLLFLSMSAQEAAVRRMAASRFDRGLCGVAAQTVSFREDCVEVSSERYEAKIPYGMLFSACADGTTILLCTAADESRIIPKRTMNREEQKRVESLLAAKLNQKFKQEGAREWTK